MNGDSCDQGSECLTRLCDTETRTCTSGVPLQPGLNVLTITSLLLALIVIVFFIFYCFKTAKNSSSASEDARYEKGHKSKKELK